MIEQGGYFIMVMRLHLIAPLLDFFLFRLKTTWLGSMKQLFTKDLLRWLLSLFALCSLLTKNPNLDAMAHG
jgi:hypothetical protein